MYKAGFLFIGYAETLTLIKLLIPGSMFL